MVKKLSLALLVLAFTVTAAFAGPATYKVTAIEGNKVQITLTGDKPSWVKKGGYVKFTKFTQGGNGKIVEVTGDTFTVQTKKASELAVGEDVTLVKGRFMAGC